MVPDPGISYEICTTDGVESIFRQVAALVSTKVCATV